MAVKLTAPLCKGRVVQKIQGKPRITSKKDIGFGHVKRMEDFMEEDLWEDHAYDGKTSEWTPLCC